MDAAVLQVEAMEAGREMDALVASRVMGWVGVHVFQGELIGWPASSTDDGEPAIYVPNFSTSIAHAWSVLERCGQTIPNHWHTDAEGVITPGEQWLTFVRALPTYPFQKTATEVAVRICRAALLATAL